MRMYKKLIAMSLSCALLIPSFAHSADVRSVFDIDGNGQTKSLSDGLLILRYLFGFRGETLINQAVSKDATRKTVSAIENYLNKHLTDLDIDGNGEIKPLTDGLLLLRYLFGFKGESLIDKAVAKDATRKTATEIESYLRSSAHFITNPSQAARFLTQATYGPTQASIDDLLSKQTLEKWLDEQFSMPPGYHLPAIRQLARKMCADRDDAGNKLLDSWEFAYPRHQIWWEAASSAPDQLRQRVALALSEILVISDSEGLGLSDFQLGVASYYDVLIKHAFGNYRDLLEEVTLHPAMGDFLSMTRNRKANEAEGIRPDENYARELLQLFTIGVHELNLDGSNKLDESNKSIPTYSQKTIEEFARVFTGWNYADISWYDYFGNADHTMPLVAVEKYHDKAVKTLFNGARSPVNQSAQADLDFALDNIFSHPNVAPFISKRLIQRLVTSNPSPAYIKRVASKFNNNGKGIKGDLKAVVKAILLDPEARSENPSDNFGKLREPMLRISHLWRAFKMQTSLKTGHYWEPDKTCGQGNYRYYNFWTSLDYFKTRTGQGPLQANSVFNFFLPDFSPGGLLNQHGLVAPEFQIVNANTLTGASNLLHEMIIEFSDSKATTPTVGGFSKFNLATESTLAANTDQLLNHLNLILLSGKMSGKLRSILKEYLDKPGIFPKGEEGKLTKAREAILLITSSPEYLIQR